MRKNKGRDDTFETFLTWSGERERERERERSQDTRLLSIKSMNSVSNLTCKVSFSYF